VHVGQHTRDWDARFRSGDTPWEDETVPEVVIQLVRAHVPSGALVLEVGCGTGTTALWLAQNGYSVVAWDVSPEAIRIAKDRAASEGVTVQFQVTDILAAASEGPRFGTVYSRGVLHTFTEDGGRRAFAAAVARCLSPGGLWLDISGSADNRDDPIERVHRGLPRVSLTEIAAAVEPDFAIHEVRRCTYGSSPGRTDFLAWASVLRRRSP